jgi:hypothetical protein
MAPDLIIATCSTLPINERRYHRCQTGHSPIDLVTWNEARNHEGWLRPLSPDALRLHRRR